MRAAARSAAVQTRDPSFDEVRARQALDPGSAAHHFVLRRVRDDPREGFWKARFRGENAEDSGQAGCDLRKPVPAALGPWVALPSSR